MQLRQKYKIILIGDAGVGKTLLITRFTDKKIEDETLPTISVEFFDKYVETSTGKKIKVELWDTAGSERYRGIVRSHFTYVTGVVLVYDLTNRQSFNNCEYWLEEIENNCQTQPVILLVANKLDLIQENQDKRQVSIEEAQKFAQNRDLIYTETSALTHKNRVFQKEVHSKFKDNTQDKSFRLGDNKSFSQIKEKKNCC